MSHTRVVIMVSCKLATYKAAWEQGQQLVRADGCNLSVHKVKVGPEALFRIIYLPYLASHQCGSHMNRFWESVLLQLLLAVIVNTCQSCYVFSPLTLSPLITVTLRSATSIVPRLISSYWHAGGKSLGSSNFLTSGTWNLVAPTRLQNRIMWMCDQANGVAKSKLNSLALCVG